MAKKVKLQSRRTVEDGASSTPAQAFSRPSQTVFNPDYTPVIKDLKRIGTLAGTFFVILVALAFILPYVMP